MDKKKLAQLLSSFINSKLYLIFKSIIFILIFFTLLYACIRFTSINNSYKQVLQMILLTLINIDIGIRIMAIHGIMNYVTIFGNKLQLLIIQLWSIIIGISNYIKLGTQQQLFFTASNVLTLGIITSIYAIDLSKIICNMVDNYNRKVIKIDYNSYNYQNKDKQNINTIPIPRNIEINLLDKYYKQKQNKQEKYMKFIDQQETIQPNYITNNNNNNNNNDNSGNIVNMGIKIKDQLFYKQFMEEDSNGL